MTGPDHIVDRARDFALDLLRRRLAAWATYHDIRHTEETVEACREIAAGSGLDEAQTEIVLLAAWFHDTGYIDTVKGHEERSAAIALEYLRGSGYPPDNISSVEGCIMATKMPPNPKNLLERIICDADMIYIGREDFFGKDDLLREEIEKREGTVIDPAAWLRRSLKFLEDRQYHTEYCRTRLNEGLKRNIETLRRRLTE